MKYRFICYKPLKEGSHLTLFPIELNSPNKLIKSIVIDPRMDKNLAEILVDYFHLFNKNKRKHKIKITVSKLYDFLDR